MIGRGRSRGSFGVFRLRGARRGVGWLDRLEVGGRAQGRRTNIANPGALLLKPFRLGGRVGVWRWVRRGGGIGVWGLAFGLGVSGDVHPRSPFGLRGWRQLHKERGGV